MDIMMPKLNGWDATRRIRSMKRSDAGNVPIIAMSANAFAEDIINSRWKKQHRNSLEKGRGYPLSFSYIRMTYRATLRTENGGTTGYNSYKHRSFFCEACGLHYGKEKNYDFIYIVSVAVNHFIRNRI